MGLKVNDKTKNVNTDLMYKDLIKKIKSYNPDVDETLLDKAYLTSKKYHKDQYRKTGEPFIIHPLEVARILADIELDQVSIAAAILHDVIEDTQYSLEMAKKDFGQQIANIINGVTKLDKIVFDSKEEQQVNNIRKMIIAMSEDVRIILVKLADRLHNMRTLYSLDKEKREKNSIETLEIYAPIAHRLGIYQIKSELEDLSFKYLYPKEYEKIKAMIDERLEERKSLINEAIDIVNKKLKEINISADISGRIKNYYSVYNKITKQNRKFEDIYDIIAIRIIVNDVKNCYESSGNYTHVMETCAGKVQRFYCKS